MADILNLALPYFSLIFIGFARRNDAWIEPASVAVMIGTFASVVTLTTAMWLIQSGQFVR